MNFLVWCGILVAWSFAGVLIWLLLGLGMEIDLLRFADGLEFVNPLYIYRQVQVNWFGAFFLAIVFSALSPLLAFGYWFYKLCTVGRKVK